MPEHWIVLVQSPDGETVKVHLSPEQVKYFAGTGTTSDHATAAYLAYCDLWAKS